MAKIGLYGGGFKPPTKGHFEVVQKIINEYPDLDMLIVLVGKGIRNGISQDEAILIWDIYKKYLPFKVRITPVSSPIGEIYSLAKGNLEDEFVWFLGERQGKEEDVKDIEIRTKHLTNKKDNYPNLTTAVISTGDANISGTQARKYLKNQDKTGFFSLLPDSLSNEEKDEVYNILSPSIEEGRKKKRDPKKGTGKKPEGSGRRLYTDEDPKDTVGIKFRTKEDIVDTLNKKSFKSKSHARQSQIINLIHQRVRAAYQNAKDSDTKSRLKRGLDYIEKKKEASKAKTQRLKKLKEEINSEQAFSNFDSVQTIVDGKRNLAYVVEKGDTPENWQRVLDLIKDNNLMVLPVEGNPYKAFIIHTPDSKDEAIELKDIAEKYDGYLASNTNKEDTIEVGRLLDYKEEDIQQYIKDRNINENFSLEYDRVEYYKNHIINVIPSTMEVSRDENKIIVDGILNEYPPGFNALVVEDPDIITFAPYVTNTPIKTPPLMEENIDPKSQEKHSGKSSPYGSAYEPVEEGDTYEKMAAKGKKSGNLKQGTVRKRLGMKKGEKIPLSKINKEISRLKKMDQDDEKKGVQLGDKNQKYYKALQLAKTLKTTTNVNENHTYSNYIDLKQQITDLTKHMLDQGEKITPLPKLVFKHGDSENAKEFLGKTAYYDPNTMTIVLYTEGRHPKDIVRSFSHEMVHHKQNLENRLNDINTTNTLEDDHLDQIEREAYEEGNMTFRNYTDNLQEGKKKDPFGITAYAYELARGLEEQEEKVETKYTIYSDMDGVLTDFDARFKEFSKGIAPRDYENKFGTKKFWNLVDNIGGKDFWANMDWMPDGKQYWSYIQKYDPIILTAPSMNSVSRLGKRQWRDGNLPGVSMKMASARNKPNYSKRNAILIDDREDTIAAWNAMGGIGIHHTSAANTINKLKELGL